MSQLDLGQLNAKLRRLQRSVCCLQADGSFPDQTGHAGEFLSTNGTDPFWTTNAGGDITGATNLGGGLANFDSKIAPNLQFNTFNASDFNLASNLISIDYANGQAATALQDGFLQAADWTTFNNKANATGSTGYIWNSVVQQPSSNFNISGAGVVGTTLTFGRSAAGERIRINAPTAYTGEAPYQVIIQSVINPDLSYNTPVTSGFNASRGFDAARSGNWTSMENNYNPAGTKLMEYHYEIALPNATSARLFSSTFVEAGTLAGSSNTWDFRGGTFNIKTLSDQLYAWTIGNGTTGAWSATFRSPLATNGVEFSGSTSTNSVTMNATTGTNAATLSMNNWLTLNPPPTLQFQTTTAQILGDVSSAGSIVISGGSAQSTGAYIKAIGSASTGDLELWSARNGVGATGIVMKSHNGGGNFEGVGIFKSSGSASTLWTGGGTDAGSNLTLSSTTNVTKGLIKLGASSAYDEANVRLGLGFTTIANKLSIKSEGNGTGVVRIENSANTNSLFYLYQTGSGHGDFIVYNSAGVGVIDLYAGGASLIPELTLGSGPLLWAVDNTYAIGDATHRPSTGTFGTSLRTPKLGVGIAADATIPVLIKSTGNSTVPIRVENSANTNTLAQLSQSGAGHADLLLYNASGTVTVDLFAGGAGFYNTGGNFVFGSTTASARLHTVSTTEQLRVGYDASNYYSTTVASTGGVTFDAVGSGSAFTFSDPITLSASENHAYRAITALRTLDATDYVVDATANTFTVTLPDPTSIVGRVYVVKNSGVGTITVTPEVGTIDGAASKTLGTQYSGYMVQAIGAGGYIIISSF